MSLTDSAAVTEGKTRVRAPPQQQTCQSCYTLTHTNTNSLRHTHTHTLSFSCRPDRESPSLLPLTVGRILRSDGKCAQQQFDQQVSHRQHATRAVETSEFLLMGLSSSLSSSGNTTPRRVTELLNLVRGAHTQGETTLILIRTLLPLNYSRPTSIHGSVCYVPQACVLVRGLSVGLQ